jgi:hypothetical protein
VASFRFPFEADMARFRLGLEGIHARLADEATVGWFWYYALVLGGVKVIVRAEDLPAAREILARERAAEVARRLWESAAELPSREPAAPGDTAEEPPPESWICPKCREEVPGGWETCWACGTTADGQADPDFAVADAPIVEHDWDCPPAVWWPLACFLCPALFVYDLMFRLCPERPPQRLKRRVSFAPLDPRLIRACLLAVLAIGWFPPFALASLWLLRKVDWGKGVQRQRTRTFFRLALALNLVWLGMLLLPLVYLGWLTLFLENSGWAPG